MDAAHGVCSSVESSTEYAFGRVAAFLCDCQKQCRCGHKNPHKPGSPAAVRFVYGMADVFEAAREAKRLESKSNH